MHSQPFGIVACVHALTESFVWRVAFLHQNEQHSMEQSVTEVIEIEKKFPNFKWEDGL